MNIKVEIHKLVKELMNIKASSFIIFVAFVSSFNLWYLSLYFFKPDFIEMYGLITMLQTSFALTMTWFVISVITSPKLIILNLILTLGKDFDLNTENEKDDEDFKKAINISTLANTLITHSSFLFITYILDIPFIWMVAISFGYHFLLYILIDILLKYIITQEQIKTTN